MADATLNLEERSQIGGKKTRRLREHGYIPAVVYGRGMDAKAVQVKTSDFRDFLSKYGRNSVFTTEFAAEHNLSLLVKDIQFDELRNDIFHVDFQRVSLTEKIRTEVPVKVIGEDQIKKSGSVVVHQLNEIEVECLPQDVPQYVNADVSGMTPGHSLTASSLNLPQGVTLLTDPGSIILSVTNSKLDMQVNKSDEPVIPAGEEGSVKAKDT